MDKSKLQKFELPLAPSFEITCDTHCHIGNLPCPWPNCPKGIIDDSFIGRRYIFPPKAEEKVFIRKSWKAEDGSDRFSWDDITSFSWLGFNKIIREELIRCTGQPNYPEIIYHYTSVEGLFNIINSKELWLSDYNYMNDSREIIHGVEMAEQIIKKMLNEPRYQRKKNIIESWKKYFTESSIDRLCISCFSTEADSLSQWRAYGGKNTGVCIGFRVNEHDFWYGNSELRLTKVIYNKRKQEQILRNLFHLYVTMSDWDINKQIRDFDGNIIDSDKVNSYYQDDISPNIFEYIVSFKNKSFEDEKEIRWVYKENKKLLASMGLPIAPKRHRVSANQIIPYITSKDLMKIDISNGKNNDCEINIKLPIEEIVVGPQANISLVIQGIEDFLSKAGFPKIPVVKSNVPYRNTI